MSYLAMEMSLYLASAALIGIVMGWLIWGQGRRRYAAKIKAEMAATVKAERGIAAQANEALKDLEAKQVELLEAEKASSAKALAEVRQLLETEKKEAHTIKTEMSQLRMAMDEAINAEKASASNAIQEAMRNAENLTIAAREAELRETQTRAELEESRLMIGAEKLAAQSARSELSQLRQEMQQALEVERQASAQARKALNDIQSTLARTFGEGAAIVTAAATSSETPAAEPNDQLELIKTDVQVFDDDPYDEIDAFNDSVDGASFDTSGDQLGIDVENVEPGVAFDVQDEGGATADKSEANDELVNLENTLEASQDGEPLLSSVAEGQDNDSNVERLKPDLSLEPLNLSNGQANSLDETVAPAKPASFLDDRPDEVDELQAIEGIDPDIEKLLNDRGCYHLSQLAQLTDNDIEWLCQASKDVPDLKERILRDDWVEQARDLLDKKFSESDTAKPRWWNRRRLQ